jgi:hypothetical protein
LDLAQASGAPVTTHSVPVLVLCGCPASGHEAVVSSLVKFASNTFAWRVVSDTMAQGLGARPDAARTVAALTQAASQLTQVRRLHAARRGGGGEHRMKANKAAWNRRVGRLTACLLASPLDCDEVFPADACTCNRCRRRRTADCSRTWCG